jgi:hypothetical protein
MADADKTLKVGIDLGVTGLDKAAEAPAALGKTRAAADDLNQSMGVVNVSQKEVADILGKTGETAGLTHLQFRRLANTLGRDIPGAAALMEAGFAGAESKMLGSIFLLISGVEMWRNALNKINEEEKESTKIEEALSDADAQQTDSLEKQREAIEKADVSQAEFYHEYIRNTHDAVDAAEKFAQAILKAESSRNQDNDSKQKGIAGSEIEEMEKRGVLSHAAALKAKEQLDIEFESRKLIRQMAADALEQSMAINTLNNKEVATEGLQRNEASAEEKYKTAANAKIANDTKIDEASRRISAGQDTQKSLRDTGITEETVQQLGELFSKLTGKDAGTTRLSEQFTALAEHDVYGTGGSLGITDTYAAHELVKKLGSQGDRNLATYEGANIDIAAGKSDLERGRKKSTDVDINEGNAKSDLELSRKEVQKNKDEVVALQEQIKTKSAENAIKNSGAQQDLGESKASAELSTDRGIADKIISGAQTSAVDQRRLIEAASAIAGHTVNLSTAVQIIENGAKNIGTFMAQVGRLATVFSHINPDDLQRQIDALQSQIKGARNHTSG